MEVAAAHLDDRTETAAERAPARGLDDIELASEHRAAGEHPGSACRRQNLSSRGCGRRARRVPVYSRRCSKPETRNAIERQQSVEGTQQLAKRDVAFATD